MKSLSIVLAVVVALALAGPARSAEFNFHSVMTLDAMHAALKRDFPLGTLRSALDATLSKAAR